MKILLTGATGFIGRRLCERLFVNGNDLVILSRNARDAAASLPVPARCFDWDPVSGPPPLDALDGVDAVVHLAGESVAGRWSKARKQAIRDSRVLGSRHLMEAIEALKRRPSVLVAASAIGIYGDRGDETLADGASHGEGFLAEVTREWEAETIGRPIDGLRAVALRIGIVLGRGGGALDKMLPPFAAGLGGPIGSGKQYMSWIHIDDLVSLIEFALTRPLRGALNAVAPGAVSNREFSKCLGAVLKRPAITPVPAIALRAALGEMSFAVLASQRVEPTAAVAAGFRFAHPGLRGALESLLGGAGEECIEESQFVARPIGEVFDFFSRAENLEKITPPWLGFNVLGRTTPEIERGTKIDYRLRLHGLPLRWQSLISEWEPGRKFVDEQVRGPYSLWHHTHSFEPVRGGTLVRDRVRYRLPLGALGGLAAGAWVRKDVARIFRYRRERIRELLG